MRLTLLFTLFACAIHAQQLTDFNQIIAPLDSPAVDFKEYLVQLAWINSPEGRIAAEEVLNAKDRNSNTKKEWMRDIQATFNLNEGNLRQQNNASGNVFFPRYNFGATLNVFNILSQKDKNSIAKRDIIIAEQKVNQRKYAIRAETLTRYAFFNMANSVLLSRRQVEQDTKSALVLIEQQYRSDEKSFDDFTTASSSFYQAQEARIRQENEVLQAQIRLEEIIGLMWIQVVHPNKI
jgi:outer membrane protein TolC